ncbi:O-antigen ligase family protein [Halanaerobium sp. Z-7514]|uniref:O-antigen ligase family protein n=1 Tax=Halanaerobium polyolivorans TaxID=2886943 RepID=A0AAW4X1H5_9FIRM|nr:O-antigen ligase family protein [Halanaerobium polyolivorans]MCC3145665.1 O-antigen ligase family protein [Halanaerobium polyolivorans]
MKYNIFYNKMLFYLLVITVFFSWFDGINYDGHTISKITGFFLGIFWLFNKTGQVILKKKYKMKINHIYQKRFFVLFMLFIFYVFSNIIFHQNFNLRDLNSLISLIFMLLFVIMFIDIVDSKYKLKIIINTIIYSSVTASIILIISFIFTRERSIGLLSDNDPNYAAMRLLPVIILYLKNILLKSEKLKVKKLVIATLILFGLILTGSISAYITFGFIITLLLFERKTKTIIIISFLIFIIVFALFNPSINRRVVGGLEELIHGETEYRSIASIRDRFELNKTSMEIWLDNNLLLGVGFGQYRDTIGHYNEDLDGKVAHNTYFEILVELGLIGLFIYLILILNLFLISSHFPFKNVSIDFKYSILSCIIMLLSLSSNGFPKILIILFSASYIKDYFLRLNIKNNVIYEL